MTKLVWRKIPPITEGWYYFRSDSISERILYFYANGIGKRLRADPSYLFGGTGNEYAGPIPSPIEEPEHTAPPAELEAERE